MIRYVMLHYVMLRCVVLSYTMLCYALLCFVMLCHEFHANVTSRYAACRFRFQSIPQVIVGGALCHDSGDLLEVELPIAIGTVPLRRSYGMINKLVPTSRLKQSYMGGGRAFVTIKNGKKYLTILFEVRAKSCWRLLLRNKLNQSISQFHNHAQ